MLQELSDKRKVQIVTRDDCGQRQAQPIADEL